MVFTNHKQQKFIKNYIPITEKIQRKLDNDKIQSFKDNAPYSKSYKFTTPSMFFALFVTSSNTIPILQALPQQFPNIKPCVQFLGVALGDKYNEREKRNDDTRNKFKELELLQKLKTDFYKYLNIEKNFRDKNNTNNTHVNKNTTISD